MNNRSERDEQRCDIPITYPDMSAMLRGLLRYDRLFGEAIRAGLKPHHFGTNPDETAHQVLYASMCVLREQYGAITKPMLIHHIASLIVGNHVELTPGENEWLLGRDDSSIQGFIEEAFDTPPLSSEQEAAEKRHVESILRRFLNSRLIKQSLQSVLNRVDANSAPEDIAGLLENFCRQSQRVKHVGEALDNAAALPVFGSPIDLPPPPEPTNVPWIDQYIGGTRPRDLIGLLAPFGGGKTTMGISAAVRIAENYYLTEQNKIAVYVCFEDGAEKMRHLCWSAAAQIERRLFDIKDVGIDPEKFWRAFSTADTLKDYEFALPINQNGKVMLGERERWESISDWYNKHFVFLDFAHSTGTSARGNGGPVELAEVLKRVVEERKCDIGFVVIDYAGRMIDRMIGIQQQDQLWRYIKLLPDELRRHIADEFDATLLIAHQLAAGDIKSYPPSRYSHHHDSQGGKSFAENLHACCCLGMRDIDTKACTLHWSKIRAFMPESPLGIVKIHDHYVDVNLVNDKYRVCKQSKKILLNSDIHPFTGGRETSSRRNSSASVLDPFTANFGDA
jgi:hypothetical protein